MVPPRPAEPEEMVEDFRRFARAVAAHEAEDVHWAIQSELIDRLPIDHGAIGSSTTLWRSYESVGGEHWPTEKRQENRTPVPLPPAAYDEQAAAALNDALRRGLRPLWLQAGHAGRRRCGHEERGASASRHSFRSSRTRSTSTRA